MAILHLRVLEDIERELRQGGSYAACLVIRVHGQHIEISPGPRSGSKPAVATKPTISASPSATQRGVCCEAHASSSARSKDVNTGALARSESSTAAAASRPP